MIKKTIPLISCFLFVGSCFAENHALVIGIGSYPFQPLEGPKHDANAIEEVLNKKWRVEAKNITTLIDQQATRKNILASLDSLYDKTKKGDNVFIYYSGHGTSVHDNTIQAPLPNTSGALIPYDVFGLKTKAELMEKLIKGRDDLKPRFTKLDQGGRHLFVAIDACYSGNTIRALNKPDELPTRFMALDQMIEVESSADKSAPKESNDTNEEYPYSNIFYLSAASEYERAQDIPLRFLHKIPTIDNKPHGAFTNTLLEYLYQPESADLNKDKKVSYFELTKTLTKRMEERGFSHTPSALPTQKDDIHQLANQSVFFIDNTVSDDSIKVSTDSENKSKTTILSKTLKQLGFK